MGADKLDIQKDLPAPIISFENIPKRKIELEAYFKIIQCVGKYNKLGLCIHCIYNYKCPFKRILTCDKVLRGRIRHRKKLTFEREFFKNKNRKEE